MSSNINWANPVFGPDAVPKTSQAYLARLQQFLDQQQGGSSSSAKDSNNNNNNNKRKNPSSQSDNDTSAAVKDRRHSMNNNSDEGGNTHSHTKEGSSERESPEAEDDKSGKGGRAGKGNTSDKRKEQNRNAQRAFRERKEKVLRDLEDRVNELKEAHDTSQSENQNLKEMITRLQEENAQLRKGAAPQSDFTFSIPAGATNHAPALSGLLDQSSSSSSPSTAALDKNASTSNNNNNNNNNSASSFSTNDILAYLSSAPTPQTVQQPFTMIQPSPPPAGSTSAAGSGSGPGGFDDWMLNWNSSAFGTEFPQAVPPSVTNLTEQPVDNGFASLWNSLQQQSSNFNSNNNSNGNNNSSFSNSNSPSSYTSPNNINSQSQAQQQQQLSNSVQDNSSSFFSLFQNAFTPSMNQSASSGSSFSPVQNGSSNNGNSAAAHNGNNNVGGGMPVQSIRSGSSDLFPFAASDSNGNSPSLNSNNGSGSGSGSGTLNLNSLQNNNLNRLNMNGNGSSNADSPETCASSTSGGSDPSDAQPGTPNNGAALFSGAPGNGNGNHKSMQGGGNLKHQQSADSQQSLFSNMGFGSFGLGSLTQQQQQVPQQQQQPHSFTNNSGFGNMFGSAGTGFDNVTTPSGVFDMMNYRDPLFANLGSASSDGGVFGNDNFNFTSFLSGNNGSGSGAASGGNAPKRSDTLDFSDFLVASPPALNSNSPSAGSTGGNSSSNNAFRMPSQSSSGLAGGKESSSSSSLPTLSSLSNSNSPASNQPSPQTSMTYGNSASSSQTGTPNWLPYDVPYNHPLIQHVMKGNLTAEDKERPEVQAIIAKMQSSASAGNNNINNISSSSKPMGSKSSPCDIDGLCSDMTMKATCKDAAREQIAKAIHTDEMTMKLYSEYLQAYSGPPNQN